MFSLICVWINDWVNNREAGDLRHYGVHYDVSVMFSRIRRLVMASTVRKTSWTFETKVLPNLSIFRWPFQIISSGVIWNVGWVIWNCRVACICTSTGRLDEAQFPGLMADNHCKWARGKLDCNWIRYGWNHLGLHFNFPSTMLFREIWLGILHFKVLGNIMHVADYDIWGDFKTIIKGY